MKRRDFTSVMAGSTLAAMGFYRKLYGLPAQNTQYLVETPEKRFYYLKKMLKQLCTDLGPHPSGSPEYERAMNIIKKEMDTALPIAELDEYTFENWKLMSEPEFWIGGTQLETFPFHGCSDTPSGGIRGVLKKLESKGYPYGIADESTGNILAYVSVSIYGPAIPRSAYNNSEKSLPIFGIGKYDIPVLESAVKNHTPVHANFRAKFIPDTLSWNVVGTLPGNTHKEILLLAHLDTVYPSPGANDNTASVITMLMLAHAFSGTKQDFTITFIATGSEECGSFGAQHYAKKREDAGTMKNITYIIQFDSLTYGPDFLLTSKDEELKSIVQQINNELGIKGIPRLIDSDAYVMDAAPFLPSGARAIYINSRGYDGITLPVYHRPEDIPETVGFDCVDNSFLVFKEFIMRIQKL